MPQIGWLQQQAFISQSSGKWGIQDQRTGRVQFLVRALFLDGRQSVYCCVLPGRGGKENSGGSYWDTNAITELHPHDLL